MAFNYGRKMVTDGLVLYLDAANPKSYISGSTTWNDLSKRGNNGTLINGPTYNSASGGNIVFDGVNDYLDLGDKDDFTQQSFTFDLFFKPQNFNRKIIDKYQVSGYEYTFGFFGNNTLYGWVSDLGGSSKYNGRTAPITFYTSLNTWGHYVWSVDATSNYLTKLYFNGVQIDNANFAGGGPVTTISNTPTSLTMGDSNTTGLFGPIHGSMGFVRMYNRVLPAQEILQNYNALKGRFNL